jgi:hypothetical protein
MLGLVAPAAATSAAAADVDWAPHPVVDGPTLRDARTGEPWVPHGVNWPGFEYACAQGWTPAYSRSEAAAIASWGVDLVRLPLNQDCWLGVDGAPSPAAGSAADYRLMVADWVGLLHEAGLAVILDLHWTAPAGVRADGQRAMADSQSVQFWASAAAAFRGDPALMFELFNEPYSRWSPSGPGHVFDLSWTCWRDGGCAAPVEADTATSLGGSTYSVVGMAQLVDAIRGAGAQQPLLLGGRDYANDLTGWLAHRPDDDQLIAAWHNYQGQACDVACWNSAILDVAATAPVLMTEFGDTTGGHSYFDQVLAWSYAHDIGVIPWAWWDVEPSESVQNSLYALYDGNFTPRAPSGTAYRAFLDALPEAPDPPGTYGGVRVVDSHGVPVAGAVILLDSLPALRTHGDGVARYAEGDVPHPSTSTVGVQYTQIGISHPGRYTWTGGSTLIESADPSTATATFAGSASSLLELILPISLPDGSISGTVKALSPQLTLGVDVSDVHRGVELYSLGLQLVRSVVVDADGGYEITGVPAGTYLMRFAAVADFYAPVFYRSAHDIDAATPVVVHDGEAVAGVDQTVVSSYVPSFTDVPPSSQFASEIGWVASGGVAFGYADGGFGPLRPVARDAMAAFLYRLAGSPAFTPPTVSPFRDVATSNQFFTEIAWLASEGISTGYPDGTFRPLDPVSRETMAAFLYRYSGSPSFTAPPAADFSDVPESSQFFREVSWLASTGVATGYPDGSFRPVDAVHRDAMAAFLFRVER